MEERGGESRPRKLRRRFSDGVHKHIHKSAAKEGIWDLLLLL
jgi:hypothetical protein